MPLDPVRLGSELTPWIVRFEYEYLGASGTALLFDLFRSQNREFVLLPAFTCHGLSQAARSAGKTVVHIDAKPGRLYADDTLICRWLEEHDPAGCILLVDSAFGVPFPVFKTIRRRFPDLYIIEDCVRGLGCSTPNERVGRYADSVLLSMYKTISGNDHGAILLSKHLIPVTQGPRRSTSLQQRLAPNAALRHLYEEWKRRRPADLGPAPDSIETSSWSPSFGTPSELCIARFRQELADFEKNCARRKTIYQELASAMDTFDRCKLLLPDPGCEASCHYLSFVTAPDINREELLQRLHHSGLFLLRTWDLIPSAIRCFKGTFPYGWAEASRLASSVVHIPILSFQSRPKRDRLLNILRPSLG